MNNTSDFRSAVPSRHGRVEHKFLPFIEYQLGNFGIRLATPLPLLGTIIVIVVKLIW